jgi:hypothetical protein
VEQDSRRDARRPREARMEHLLNGNSGRGLKLGTIRAGK